MKKLILLLLALALCLCACGGGEPSIPTDNENTQNTNGEQNGTIGENGGTTTEVEMPFVVYDQNGSPYLNVEKFQSNVEIVELSTDNWKDYLTVYAYSYQEEKVETDAFGEIVSTETITHTGTQFGADNERYHCFDDVVIELKDKETGELVIYEFQSIGCKVTEDFELDNYECTRVKGTLCFLNFPEGTLSVSAVYHAGFVNDAGELWAAAPYGLSLEPGMNAFRVSPGLEYWLSAAP